MKKILAIILISYKNYSVYLLDLLGSNLILVLRIVIISLLFKVIFATNAVNGLIGGYSLEEVTWALIIAQVIVKSRPRISEEISEDVQTGKVSIYLLNPISYMTFKFLENFSKFLYNLFLVLLIGLVVGYIMLGNIPTDPRGIFAGIVLLFGAMFITFFGYFMVGLLAFYTEESESFRFIYSKIDMILGGNILPVVFLPGILQTIAFFAPFAYAGYTAGLIFSRFEYDKFIFYLQVQLVWIVIFIIICNLVYMHAKKKLVVNGG